LRQLAITSTLNAWVTAIAVDPTTHDIVFITNGKYPQGEVTVLDPTLHVVAGASLNYWVDDMVIDPLTRQIIIGRLLTDLLLLPWAPSQSRILTQTRVTVGVGPHRLAVDGSTAIVYVTNGSSHTVSVVDVRTTRVVATTPIGPPATVYYTNDNSGPGAIAVDPVTHEVYVADRGGSTVTVLQGLATPSTATPAALPTGGGGGMAGCTPP
jgi:YVTN family beta-propeller protein